MRLLGGDDNFFAQFLKGLKIGRTEKKKKENAKSADLQKGKKYDRERKDGNRLTLGTMKLTAISSGGRRRLET